MFLLSELTSGGVIPMENR